MQTIMVKKELRQSYSVYGLAVKGIANLPYPSSPSSPLFPSPFKSKGNQSKAQVQSCLYF